MNNRLHQDAKKGFQLETDLLKLESFANFKFATVFWMEKSISVLFQRLPMLSVKDVLKEAHNTPTSNSFGLSGDDV